MNEFDRLKDELRDLIDAADSLLIWLQNEGINSSEVRHLDETIVDLLRYRFNEEI